MPLLSIAVLAPLLGAALSPFLPVREGRTPLALAAAMTAISAACIVATWVRFDPGQGMQLVEEARWIPTLDVAWRLGVDGMALALCALTVLLFAVSVVHGVGPRPMGRAACGLLLLLEGSTLAFFLAEDFILFYVAFDVTLVAMYFLIALWGEEERRYAALKFFLYTLIGSLPVLLGIIALYLHSEPHTFDMIRLAADPAYQDAGTAASLVFLAFLVGFAIKTPIVPFHTWLPAAHVQAPTTGSILLAGVLLKMGTYGLVRVNLQMLSAPFAKYALAVAILGLVSALWGTLIALAQTDLKRLIAYTSVNHMGYVVMAVAAAAASGISPRGRELAIDGAVLQMVAHGLVTAALFLLAGLLKQRTHTRDLRELAGLLGPLPRLGVLVAIACFASLGIPGLAQFPAELQIFLGTFDVFPVIAGLALLGLAVTAALFLRVLQSAFMGPTPDRFAFLPDLDGREALAALPLVAAFVAIGVYPRVILDVAGSAAWLVGAG